MSKAYRYLISHSYDLTLQVLAILSLVLFLTGCIARPSQTGTASDVPAPTAIPLQATITPGHSIPTDIPPSPTNTIMAVSTVPAPTAVPLQPTATPGVPLRLIPPARSIALPPGFTIGVYAQGLNNPRMMTIGPDGQLYVAERGANRIIRLSDLNGDGNADSVQVVAAGLNSPSSLAFYKDGSLYVGETTRILRLSEPNVQGVFQKSMVVIDNLPSGGHSTRTVLFSPDWSSLFVSIGSSCNVCIDTDPRRAAIVRYNPDGSGEQIFARGLRNAVGITFRPGTDELWATNNGRDLLGDDLPPDTINLAQQGEDFGFPRCHSGRIIDPQFGSPSACQNITRPAVELQAHSAPLGLTFYTGTQFPSQYQGNLFVAFHGSWNRTIPTGYKIVRIPMQDGNPGPVQDFATGWLVSGKSWGRPVDLVVGPDGSLFVSDDAGGMIYRILYTGAP
jgi:glucose/arabinose dehydrogenase